MEPFGYRCGNPADRTRPAWTARKSRRLTDNRTVVHTVPHIRMDNHTGHRTRNPTTAENRGHDGPRAATSENLLCAQKTRGSSAAAVTCDRTAVLGRMGGHR